MNSYESTVKELQDRIASINHFLEKYEDFQYPEYFDNYQINSIKRQLIDAKQVKKELEERLEILERTTPEIEKKLGFIDGPNHVSGRVYSMSDGCFNMLLIFFLIDAIIAFIVLLITGVL